MKKGRERAGRRGGEENGRFDAARLIWRWSLSSKASVRANATSRPAGNYPVATATAIKSCKVKKGAHCNFERSSEPVVVADAVVVAIAVNCPPILISPPDAESSETASTS